MELHYRFRRKMDQSPGRLVNFRLMYLVTQLIGIALIILIISWVAFHLKGFGWDYEQPSILFNWHPLFMTIGMVFLYGNCEFVSCIPNVLINLYCLTYSYPRLSRFSLRPQEEPQDNTRVDSRTRILLLGLRTYCSI